MRTFIALELPENVKEEIVKMQKQIEKSGLMRGKLTEKENLHLTLKFLGEISDDKAEAVKNKLKSLKFNRFECQLGEIGVFSESFVRIVWVSLQSKEVFELQKQIDEVLKDMFAKEERFMAHITIARPKFIEYKKAFIENLGKIAFKKEKFIIDKIYLKKSELKSEGPVYEDLMILKMQP